MSTRLLSLLLIPILPLLQCAGRTDAHPSKAQLESRSRTPDKAGDKTGPSGAPLDDGFGMCPPFTHYHATYEELAEIQGLVASPGTLDGLCHRDDNDDPIGPMSATSLPGCPVSQFYDYVGGKWQCRDPRPNPKWRWL